MARRAEVEEAFAELREHFRSRSPHDFELQDMDDELHALASKGETVGYMQLGGRHGLARGGPRGIGTILDTLDERERYGSGCRSSLHHISAVVVLANTDYPSGGFFGVEGLPPGLERSPRQWTNPTLSRREKDYVESVWRHLQDCVEP